MKFRLLSVVTLTALSLFLLGACSDQFANCDEDKTCLGASAASGGTISGGNGTTDSGDGDTGSGGAETGDGDGDGDTSGGNGDAGGGADGSGGTIIDPCEACEGETPVCVNDECVACSETESGACSDEQQCSGENTCVSCLDNSHCTTPEASVCDLSSETYPNSCIGCVDDEGCAHLEDTAVCDTDNKTCVECTMETEAEQCDLTACNPATLTCTKTTRGTSKACEPCLADSECRTGYHCVPMTYQGEGDTTPQDRGGYCLKTNTEGCSRPYQISITDRQTLSGTKGEVYCGINEALTTCEAVLALVASETCPNGDECPEGGACKKVGDATPNQCTYKCSAAFECLLNTSGGGTTPGSTCGDGTAEDLDNANFYCGG